MELDHLGPFIIGSKQPASEKSNATLARFADSHTTGQKDNVPSSTFALHVEQKLVFQIRPDRDCTLCDWVPRDNGRNIIMYASLRRFATFRGWSALAVRGRDKIKLGFSALK